MLNGERWRLQWPSIDLANYLLLTFELQALCSVRQSSNIYQSLEKLPDFTLTYDLDIQSSATYGHELLRCKRSRSTVSRFQRQNGNKRTDGHADGGDYITCLANAVGNSAFVDIILRPGSVLPGLLPPSVEEPIMGQHDVTHKSGSTQHNYRNVTRVRPSHSHV